MHKIEIPEIDYCGEFPSCLEEMTGDQFIFFMDMLLKFESGSIDIDEFKCKLVMNFLDIRMTGRYYLLKKEKQEDILSKIYLLSGLIDSFFTEEVREEKSVFVLKMSFIKQFLPKIAGKYYGPEDGLSNCTFCEYRTAYGYYKAYLNSKQEDDLNHLIAVLYRPKRKFLCVRRELPGYDGQLRTLFTAKSNPRFIETRAMQIGKLSMAIRYGIFLFFAGCNEYLTSGEITIEENKIDLSLLYKKSSSDSPDPGIGLVGLLYSIAETHIFGSIDETDNQNIYDIMIRLYQVMKQFEAMKPK